MCVSSGPSIQAAAPTVTPPAPPPPAPPPAATIADGGTVGDGTTANTNSAMKANRTGTSSLVIPLNPSVSAGGGVAGTNGLNIPG